MTKPRVLNAHHTPKNAVQNAEWKDAVYCGRGSPWGNPFKMGPRATRDEVCDRFEKEVLPTLDVTKLRGKNLICFCAPKRCHCDAILKKANEG